MSLLDKVKILTGHRLSERTMNEIKNLDKRNRETGMSFNYLGMPAEVASKLGYMQPDGGFLVINNDLYNSFPGITSRKTQRFYDPEGRITRKHVERKYTGMFAVKHSVEETEYRSPASFLAKKPAGKPAF